MKANKQYVGKKGEHIAVEYLRNEGYEILETNYRFGHTEIDIVAKEGDELVFIEVKTRRSDEYGDPADAITEVKEERFRHAAEGYFYEHELEDQMCRFDFIGIKLDGTNIRIQHVKNVLE